MSSYRALIVDDERLARRELAYLLREHPQIEIVAEASSVAEAVEAIDRTQPDLVFLDIQMPGESAFDLFDRVRLKAKVIFVTAHDQFALRAFEVNALDYLMKPVNPARLRQAIERHAVRDTASSRQETAGLRYEDSVFVSVDQNPRFVPVSSLVCILAEGDYTRLVGETGSIGLVLKPLKDWEEQLPERNFVRIQRSAIINCAQVTKFDPWFNGAYKVHLKALAEPIIMSRRYARRFRARFKV